MSVNLRSDRNEQGAVLPVVRSRTPDAALPSEEDGRGIERIADAVAGEDRRVVSPQSEGPRKPPPGKDEILIISPG